MRNKLKKQLQEYCVLEKYQEPLLDYILHGVPLPLVLGAILENDLHFFITSAEYRKIPLEAVRIIIHWLQECVDENIYGSREKYYSHIHNQGLKTTGTGEHLKCHMKRSPSQL